MKKPPTLQETSYSLIQGSILLILNLCIFGCTSRPSDVTNLTISEADSVSLTSRDSLAGNSKDEMISLRKMVKDYLDTKKISPDFTYVKTYGNDDRSTLSFRTHKISWTVEKKGIKITIDGKTISTSDKITRNIVWGDVDSVNFANTLDEVKLYKNLSIVLLTFRYTPCSGLACGVEYQLLYDLKTGQESYFGTFSGGFDAALYNFNGDKIPDFLSTTFYGRNEHMIDTTTCVMYSQSKKGDFQEYKTNKHGRFLFKLIEPLREIDSLKKAFEEDWVEEVRL